MKTNEPNDYAWTNIILDVFRQQPERTKSNCWTIFFLHQSVINLNMRTIQMFRCTTWMMITWFKIIDIQKDKTYLVLWYPYLIKSKSFSSMVKACKKYFESFPDFFIMAMTRICLITNAWIWFSYSLSSIISFSFTNIITWSYV